MSIATLLASMIDPRGRCNRKGLVVAALLMVAAEAVLALTMWSTGRGMGDPLLMPFKAALLYLAISAAIQRLHDLGHSGWTMLWATLGLIGWSTALGLLVISHLPPERLVPGEIGHTVVFGGILVPLIATLLWLHFSAGEAKANSYGPVPTGLGFSRPAGATEARGGGALATSL